MIIQEFVFVHFIEKRFVDRDTSVEDYVESLGNKNTKEKTKRDVKLLETLLRNEKSDERGVGNIEPAPCGLYSFCET